MYFKYTIHAALYGLDTLFMAFNFVKDFETTLTVTLGKRYKIGSRGLIAGLS